MINKVLRYLDSKKEGINNFLPLFLASYMVLLILPYVWGRVTIMNNFFSTGWSQILYRFFSMMYAFIYLGLVGLSNRIKINRYFLIGGCILVTCFIVSWIISPKTIYDLDGSIIVETKWWWYLFGLARFSIAVVLLIFISHFVHPIMRDGKPFNLALYVLIGVTLFACLFSFIFEYKDLYALFSGADPHSIALSSIFQNKNSYGLFIFLSSLAISYIIFTNDDDPRNSFLFIPLLVFTLMAILVGARTSFLACILLLFYLFIRSLIMIKPVSKKTFYILISSASILLLAILLFLIVPVFHSGPLSSFYNIIIYMFKQLSGSFESRIHIWSALPKVMEGGYWVVGANTTNAKYLLHLYTSYYDFHSGYIHWFATTGILGSLVYLGLFVFVIYLIVKLFKKDPLQAGLIAIFLLSAMIYAFTETAVLFISTSIYAYVLNLLVVVYLQYSLRDKKA